MLRRVGAGSTRRVGTSNTRREGASSTRRVLRSYTSSLSSLRRRLRRLTGQACMRTLPTMMSSGGYLCLWISLRSATRA
jgi:hypothetical protein